MGQAQVPAAPQVLSTAPPLPPEAPSQTTSESKPQQKAPAIQVPDAHAARMAQREYAKYSSVSSMQKADKVQALKDPSINPFKLEDPYDGGMAAMHKWKTLASSKEAQSATPEQRQQVADNYYESVVYPLYEGMHQRYGAPIPTKENWRENAYGSALKFDLDDAYDSHWKNGLYEGFKDFEQIAKTGFTLLGGTIKMNYDELKATLGGADEYVKFIDDRKAKVASQGVYNTLSKDAADVPVIGHVIESLHKAISKDQFWHDVNPNTTWGQKARSWAVENAMTLPLYEATGGFTRGVVAGISGGEAVVPLTKLLSASERGRTAAKLLLNGTEGAMYGYTMADDRDKPRQMISGAIGQAILGTIFSFGGKKVKLSEMVDSTRAAELEEEGFKTAAATVGWVHGDTEKLGDNLAQSLKGASLAGGRPHLMNVLNAAFKHVGETENLSQTDLRKAIKAAYAKDPAAYKAVLTTSTWLRSILGGRKLSTLTDADKEEISFKLRDVLRKSDHLVQAEETETVQQVKEAAQTPVGQKVAAEVGPENYVKSNVEAAQQAAKETATRPVDEALNIAQKRDQATKATMTLKTRTRNTSAGRSVSVSPNWDVYARQSAKTTGYGTDVVKWLRDLPSDEFTKDMYDFFYPKSLKKAGLDTVETGHAPNMGKENPNLLAFMYNFKDRMPAIFRNRLRQELIDTDKVQGWLNGRKLDEPQLVRYAQGMKAHVDELLQTEKFKEENANVRGDYGNVYRSTYESPDAPTEYQLQLHVETIEKERSIIEEMFSGRPQQAQEATTAYNLLAGPRADAFAAGQQPLRMQKQEEIDSLLQQLTKGKYKKWEY